MPMMYLQAYFLAFLELTFVLVAIMLLHSLKQVIGNAAAYLAMGGILIFSQLIMAVGLTATEGIPGLSMNIGSAILFAPFMAALLITYIVDGTLEAQRFIWGMMAVVGIFSYLAFLAEKQCEWPGYRLVVVDADMMISLLQSSRTYLLAALLSLLIEFLVLPAVYEIMRGRGHRLWVCVSCAFMITLVLDTFFFELVTNYAAENWWDAMRQSYLARAISMLWVSLLTTMYLHLRDAPQAHASSSRRPGDLIIAVLGAYGHAQRLQANVREWEGRYRLVVEGSNDLIFIVAESGDILDANRMVVKSSGYAIGELLKRRFQEVMTSEVDWPQVWSRLFAAAEPGHEEEASAGGNVVMNECRMKTKDAQELVLDALISPLLVRGTRAALILARDVTQRKKMEVEREALREQLMHTQRMEAVGQLAGGVAHDFNNLLHAIQGNLDNMAKLLGDDERAQRMLGSASAATDRAATLTEQLLGFARAGKYEVTRIDVNALVRETDGFIRSVLGKKATLRVALHPDPMFVEGDFTQLEQALFNILLNAKDALPNGSGKIVLRAEPAAEFAPGWNPERAAGKEPDQFVTIRIRDSGSGMDEETRERIFEPFFTTKKSGGTGMGLAMVYGCIENHQGWVHVESAPGEGSEFAIFLPRA